MNIGNVKFWLVWSFVVGIAATVVSTSIDTVVLAQNNSTEDMNASAGNVTSYDSSMNATSDASGNISGITVGLGE